MTKLAVRHLLLLAVFMALCTSRVFSQTITIHNLDLGPYAPGSTVSVPFNINNGGTFIAQDNTFKLLMSDASGSFAAPTTVATSAANTFYATYLNFTLPNTITTGNYKFEVVATDPSITSAPTPVGIAVLAPATAPIAGTTTNPVINASFPEVFGECSGVASKSFNFFNTGSNAVTETATFFNEQTQTVDATIDLINGPFNFTAALTNYTITVKAVSASNIVSTKSYQLINNQATLGITTNGVNNFCLTGPGALVSLAYSSGSNLNYPGDLYKYTWGDGSPTATAFYTFAQLVAQGGVATHTYTTPSCGLTVGTTSNVFGINLSASNTYCSNVGTATSTTANIIITPTNLWQGPASGIACTNTPVTFKNISSPGPDPNASPSSCQDDPNAQYNWYVDGVPIGSGAGLLLGQNFVYTFTTHGIHHVTLEDITTHGCNAVNYTADICIEDPPTASFTLSAGPVCSTSAVTPVNTSTVDNGCQAPTYLWAVTHANPTSTFTTSGSLTSATPPTITFASSDTYTVSLTITPASCTPVTVSHSIIVNTPPTVTITPSAQFCGTPPPQTFDGTAGSLTQVIYTGSVPATSATYAWTVTPPIGGTFSYAGGTSATSQFPQIQFNGVGDYTVSVIATNSCGPSTVQSETITLQQAPTLSAGTAQTICQGSTVSLTGTVTGGTLTSQKWTSPTNPSGSAFSNPNQNSLTATYTPTAADITAGSVTLTLTGQTGLVGACATVTSTVTITIVPTDVVTSTAAKTICSGDNVNYAITASDASSTYSWTATVTTGAATGVTASGTSATISDVITNSNPLQLAVIKYTITPIASVAPTAGGNCSGTPFTFTVTIPALPTITPTVANAVICSGSATGISFASNQSNTKYTWTVSMPANVTGGVTVGTQTTVSAIPDILTNTNSTNQTVTYTVTAYNTSNCAGTPFTVSVDVAPLPTTADAGPTQALCGTTTTTLAGNTPIAGTGLWTQVVGPTTATFGDATSPTSTVGNLQIGGSYTFRWTITTTNNCSSTSTVSVVITAATVPGTTAATGASTVCAPTNSTTIALSGQTGSVKKWQSSIDGGTTWVDISITTTTLSVSNLTQTTQYRAVVQNGGCTIENSTATTITVNSPPPAATAGSDQTLCNTATTMLTGSDPLGFTGQWTLSGSSPAATITSPGSNITTVTGLTGGTSSNTYTFTWTVNGVSPCTNNSASVNVTVYAATVAGTTAAVGPSTLCAGINSGSVSLTGQVGNVVRWESSPDGTAWTPVSNTTTTLSYSNLTATMQYRAIVQNSTACSQETSNATTITVNQTPPGATAGGTQNLCNQTTATLTGNNPTGFSGMWTQVTAFPVTIADPTNFQTTVSGLVGGNTYTFQWTLQTNAPCANSSANVDIINAPASLGGTSSGDATVCAGSNSGVINLTGQVGTINGWEFSVDNGANWSPATSTTNSVNYSNLTQTTQYRAIIQSGTCTPAVTSSITTITVNQIPPAATIQGGNSQTLCNQASVTLTANNPGTFTGEWTQTGGSTSNILIVSPNNFQTTITGLTGGNNYSFTWTILASAPCTNTQAQVDIIDNAASVGGSITASGPSTVCAGTNSGQINLNGQLGTILNWQSSVDGGVTWQTIANTTSTLQFSNLTQTTQYQAVVQNGTTCTPPAMSGITTVTVNPPPPASNAGAAQVLCGVTTTTLTANDPGVNFTGTWTQTGGPAATIVNPNNFQTAINGLSDGNTYTFIWTINAQAPCVNTQSQVDITITPATVGGTTTSANGNAVCSGTNSGQIDLTGQVGNVIRWESSVDNGVTWSQIANNSASISFTNLMQTTQYRAVVQSGNCTVVNSAATIITANPPAPIADAGPNQILCNATTATLTAVNPVGFTGQWQQTSGPAVTIANPTNNQTAISGLVGGNTYTFSWTVFALSPCTNTQSQVIITNNADVVASYTLAPRNGCGNLNVQFTNNSNNQTGANFLWDFGDGGTSTSVNPSHTFAQKNDGRDTIYRVSLSIVGNCVQRAPLVDSVLVRPATPLAQILPVNTNGCGNFAIDVRNVSPGNNVKYDFYLYDGSSLVQHISKTDKSNALFAPISTTAKKTFTLYMIATGYCNNTGETLHIPITISPNTVVAQMFTDNNVTSGCVPLTVSFLNNSFGGDTFHYNVYDSNNNVVDQPIAGLASLPYTFSKAGTYYVTITASNACGSQESVKTRIDVYPLPTPAFAANDTVGCKDVTTTFTNNTVSNDPNTPATSLSYDWDFGDGTAHSASFQPTHTYNSHGSPYTVTLTVTNITTGCNNITSKTDYIKVEAPPGSEFVEQPDSVTTIPNYHFSFIDKTTGSPISWKWTFSDGQVSSLHNPQITFADTGRYKVTLTTTNKDGCDSTISHTVRITGTPGQLYLPNAFIPTSATAELRTFMAKGSGIKTWHLQIFNGYGALVWETTKLDADGAPVDGWDGTFKGVPAPQGVYVWQATASFINGTEWKGMSYNNSLPKRVGSVHLIR